VVAGGGSFPAQLPAISLSARAKLNTASAHFAHHSFIRHIPFTLSLPFISQADSPSFRPMQALPVRGHVGPALAYRQYSRPRLLSTTTTCQRGVQLRRRPLAAVAAAAAVVASSGGGAAAHSGKASSSPSSHQDDGNLDYMYSYASLKAGGSPPVAPLPAPPSVASATAVAAYLAKLAVGERKMLWRVGLAFVFMVISKAAGAWVGCCVQTVDTLPWTP